MVLNQTWDPPCQTNILPLLQIKDRDKDKYERSNTIQDFQKKRHIAVFMDKKTETKTKRKEQYGPQPDMGSALLDKHITAFVENAKDKDKDNSKDKNKNKDKDKEGRSNTVLNQTRDTPCKTNILPLLQIKRHIAAFMDKKTETKTKTKKEGASNTVRTQPDTGSAL